MSKLSVMLVFGTRPEAIKMAPVISELYKRSSSFYPIIIVTGQHRQMLDQVLKLFNIKPDIDLSIMTEGQTLNDVVSRVLAGIGKVLRKERPDLILVQGDTTSAFATSLAAYHHRIPIGHIEAGLRTRDKYNPFPEEINRKLISVVADLHFAPTKGAKWNLLKEGVPEDRIHVTGNTVIDAILSIRRDDYIFDNEILNKIDYAHRKVILLTTHRRESFGKPIRDTLSAAKEISKRHPEVEIVFPVHYNPNVRKAVEDTINGCDRIHLIDPLDYESFVQLMNKSYLILTDSGGIQEEAPSLGKPVLVLRETTERPEGVEGGTARLVGTSTESIISEVSTLLDEASSYQIMARAVNPYGDGKAAERIVDIIRREVCRK